MTLIDRALIGFLVAVVAAVGVAATPTVAAGRFGELQTSIRLRSRRCHGDQHCCGDLVANLRQKSN
jgi:hypothetical protein